MTGELPHTAWENRRLLVLAIEGHACVLPRAPDLDGGPFLGPVLPLRKYAAVHLGR